MDKLKQKTSVQNNKTIIILTSKTVDKPRLKVNSMNIPKNG